MEDLNVQAKLVRLLHEKFKTRNSIIVKRNATSLSLDPELTGSFIEAARLLGFPVSSRRNANKVIEAFMEIVVDQAKSQPQITLLTLNYKPKITFNLTVEQRIKVNMAKSDLLKAMQRLESHKSNPYWQNKLDEGMKKAAKIAETIRDPELIQLLEQAEAAWEAQNKSVCRR